MDSRRKCVAQNKRVTKAPRESTKHCIKLSPDSSGHGGAHTRTHIHTGSTQTYRHTYTRSGIRGERKRSHRCARRVRTRGGAHCGGVRRGRERRWWGGARGERSRLSASPMYTDCASLRSYINNRVITSEAGFAGRQPSTRCRAVTPRAGGGAASGTSFLRQPNGTERGRETQDAAPPNHTLLKIMFGDVIASGSQSGRWKGP